MSDAIQLGSPYGAIFSAFEPKMPARCERWGESIWAERGADELVECRRHETLLNIAFRDGLRFRLLCPTTRPRRPSPSSRKPGEVIRWYTCTGKVS